MAEWYSAAGSQISLTEQKLDPYLRSSSAVLRDYVEWFLKQAVQL